MKYRYVAVTTLEIEADTEAEAWGQIQEYHDRDYWPKETIDIQEMVEIGK